MSRLCANKNCPDLHRHWSAPETPVPHRVLEEPYLYCSLTCAAYDGAFSVRDGWNEQRIKEVQDGL